MKVVVNRLFHGYASVRDYLVKEALKKKEPLEIYCKDQVLVIPYNQIERKGEPSGIVSKSKFSSMSYQLIDFKWPKLKEQSPGQESLFKK